MRQHPVHSLLTPDPGERVLPEGFTSERVVLGRALPVPLVLDGLGYSLLLNVPTGRVRYWLERDAAERVADSNDQRIPQPGGGLQQLAREQVSPVLLLVRDKSPVARIPLLVHNRVLVPGDGEQQGPVLEFVVLGFNIFAEAMRGPLAGGSWVELAWRRIEKGSDAFIAPIARRKLRDQLTATLGKQPPRQTRAVAAELYSDGAPEQLLGAPRGGLNWRLTHD